MSARLLVVAAAVTASACGNHTSGNLFQTPFSAGGIERADAGPLLFTSDLGWNVELDTAKINVGPLYFNIDPPNTTDFRSGVVIAQVIQQVTVDMLNPTLQAVDAGVQGETGLAVAVEIDLLPPDPTITDPDLGLPNTATAFLAGTATQSGSTVPFAGDIVIDANIASINTPLPWLQRVNGAVCDLAFAPDSPPLTLRIDPRTWFNGTDFNELVPQPAADGGIPPGPYGWTNTSTFGTLVYGNLTNTGELTGSGIVSAYDFEFASP